MMSLAIGIFSANEHKVDRHADTDGGEDKAQDDGVTGDSSGLPGAGAEVVDQLDVTENGAEVNDNAEGDENDSGPQRDSVAMGREMGLGSAELAEEETEATDGEANAHEAEAGADPGEKGPLGRQVHSGILLCGLVHGGNCMTERRG
jgi:hypothetical protein